MVRIPKLFVANCRPHNWSICERDTIFGLKLGRRLPGLEKGDVILVRLSAGGDPKADYGVKAIWYFDEAKQVTNTVSAPWTDGHYGWILKCRPILTLPKLFSEDFETASKRSVKIPSLTSGSMCTSLVPLKSVQARGYLQNLIAEFPKEMQGAFDYFGDKKTAVGFLEDILVSLDSSITGERTVSFSTPPSTPITSTHPVDRTPTSTAVKASTPFGLVGERVDLPILNYAPLNEMGVIVLFGYYLQDLGFSHLEEIRAGFPDAIAMRPIGNGKFQRVRIEFEFRSASFKSHGHPMDGCDVIVCWIHDWKDCPLEVIELSTTLFENE